MCAVESLMLSTYALMILFSIAILGLRNFSLLALQLEQKGETNSFLYVCTLGGVLGSLLLGLEALYRLFIRAEKTEEYLLDRKS